MTAFHRLGDEEYETGRSGLNRAVEARPAVVAVAAGADDVAAAVRLAREQGRAVAVLATGHGPAVPADGAVLVNTGRMDGVRVSGRTAWVEAGARWEDVLAATTPHGLAPLNGSSPNVGAVGYTTGGGAGLLGRRFGFAADHVRRLRLVTADGTLRDVTEESEPDLFWAVRGGKDNFGIVVGMEIDLFPVDRLFGGGLYYPGEAASDVMSAYGEWARDVPEKMATSVLLVRNPDVDGVPEALRDRFIVHVRVAYSGDPAEGEDLIRPLRALDPPLLDTVRELPYREVGTIHHEPTGMPYKALDRSVLLAGLPEDVVAALARREAPFVTEIRQFGGAYARPPKVPNCVGGRDAAFSVYTGAVPEADALAARDAFLEELAPWSTGGTVLNFAGVEDTGPEQVAAAYSTADFARLRTIKTAWDPDNMFRINHNIPPG